MPVELNSTIIEDSPHKMWAEGTSYDKPLKHDVNQMLNGMGFNYKNLNIFFDELQGFWRWSCDIDRK